MSTTKHKRGVGYIWVPREPVLECRGFDVMLCGVDLSCGAGACALEPDHEGPHTSTSGCQEGECPA